MEEGKSLPQIALNAGINLTYNRVVDKVSSKAPIPDENPANKVGFAGNVISSTKRYDGPKPKYVVNSSHTSKRNPKKTPLPNDAETAFQNAVPKKENDGSAWYALSSDGKQIYRYQGTNGEVHFNGTFSLTDSNVTDYVKRRLGLR